EHEYGHAVPLLAELTADGDAVESRKQHVEDDRVVRLGGRHAQRLRPRRGEIDGIAGLTESPGDRGAELPVVLDEQNAHRTRRYDSGPQRASGLVQNTGRRLGLAWPTELAQNTERRLRRQAVSR